MAAPKTSDTPTASEKPKPTEASTAPITDENSRSQVSEGKLNCIAAYASIFGIPLALIGLGMSWWQSRNAARESRKAKTAAEQARDSATRTRETLNRFDTVSDLSRALAGINELMILQRYGSWELLPAKYLDLRNSLVSIKKSAPRLSPANKKLLQGAIQTFKSIGDEIEIALAEKKSPCDIARLNRIISDHSTEIQSVLSDLKMQSTEN